MGLLETKLHIMANFVLDFSYVHVYQFKYVWWQKFWWLAKVLGINCPKYFLNSPTSLNYFLELIYQYSYLINYYIEVVGNGCGISET